MFLRIFVFVVVSLLSSASLADQVYRWVDKSGVTQFSDSPPHRDSQLIDIREKNSSFSLKQHNQKLRGEIPESGPGANAAYHRRQEERISREKEESARKCRGYNEEIESISVALRNGDYSSSSHRNRLRTERKELRNKIAWECTLG